MSLRRRRGGDSGTRSSLRAPGSGERTVSQALSCSYGTIRATGVSRERTVRFRPRRTFRRYSLRRLFKTATRTVLMTRR